MKKRPFRRLIAAFLTMALFVTLLPNIPGAKAEAAPEDENVVEIKTFKDLHDAATLSRTNGSANTTYRLMNDIDITDADYESIANTDLKYISFGSEDPERPFEGTFDGNGHTISGLRYEEILTDPVPDTGLFSYTKGATIKNLTIKNARIEADMRAGIVVGYAEDTILQNVTVEESELAVRAADNVLLIGTDLGVRGGGIAGEMKNSVAYDCEVNNCSLITNNTSAVQALAGKDLYQGGIVGVADNSVIEYCRVIGDDPWNPDAVAGIGDDSTTARNTYARIYYDVAVGAIGGNTLYVGGIAGDITNDTKIIDSFSTAELNFYCATYVSVLGVNVGHIGGITGGIGTDNCEITRCHYAGQASSYQYNPIAVIPIIQHDINISGVSDYFRQTISYDQTIQEHVNGVFFMDSKNPDVDMDSLRNLTGSSISSNGQYGPWSDDLYGSRSAWESFGFDFTGTVDRETTGGGESNLAAQLGTHNNKWVMDRELGIPVHGNSVAATFDFPGAGTVTIAPTDLVGSAVSTTDPYTFAVQGNKASEKKITVSYTTNDGYRLVGWWRIPDIETEGAPQSNSYFENLYTNYKSYETEHYGAAETTSTTTNPVSKEDVYEIENVENEIVHWEDNDLFVAQIQALVQFHDIDKHLIDREYGTHKTTADDSDWYGYEDKLPAVLPTSCKPDSENATLIGWTTNTEDGYNAISSDKLAELKQNGEFYETGDLITEPLDLYPVYADLISNVTTIFEGNEQDSIENASLRDGVGSTSSAMGEDGTVTISVAGEGENGAFPDGYRFLGWYDENGYRISTETSHNLVGVDLTQKHTYTARFEYRVEYWVKCAFSSNSEYVNGAKYAEIWHTYKEPFQNIQGPDFYKEEFKYWVTDDYQQADKSFIPENGAGESPLIVKPEKVYSYNENTGGSSTHLYDIDAVVDFPGAGEIIMERDGIIDTSWYIWPSSYDKSGMANKGYRFIAWTWGNKADSDAEGHGDSSTYAQGNKNKKFTVFDFPNFSYRYTGHFAAEVSFHDISGNMIDSNGNSTTDPFLRRYEQSVFSADDWQYRKEFTNEPIQDEAMRFTSPAAPSDEVMQKEGYYFLGWVDKNELTQEEWDHIFPNRAEGVYTSTIEAAKPYVLKADAKVYAPMDLYPVYVKYDYDFTTNLEQAGFDTTGTSFNMPKPADEIYDNVNVKFATDDNGKYTGSATITFKADTNTKIMNDGSSDETYQVTSVVCQITSPSGEVEEEVLTPDDENGTYTKEIQAGYSYLFIANYDPVPVIYHLGGAKVGEDETDLDMVNIGSALGQSPNPKNTAEVVGNAVFAGWTTQKPDTGTFHTTNDVSAFTLVNSNTPVQQPMELWPVYVKVTINVDSNIDKVTNRTHRGFNITDVNSGTANLWANPEVLGTDGEEYSFAGWYTGYGTGDAKLLSTDANYVLAGDAVFDSSVTYTAVYEEMHRVRYHDTKGDVIYTAYVPIPADGEEARSFVETEKVTVANPNYDPEDENSQPTIEQTVKTPIDGEAFTLIQDAVPAGEQFMEWQWVQEGTGIVDYLRWADFCDDPITQDMDLYPVTNAVEVKDTKQATLTYDQETTDGSTGGTTVTPGDVTLGLQPVTDESGSLTGESIITVLLRTEYDQPYIDVIVSEKAYTANGKVTPTNKEGEQISLYLSGDGTLDNVSLYDTKETDNSNPHMQAVGIHAHFVLYGELQLTKQLAEGTETDPGEVFMFKVDLGNGNVQTLPVTAGQTVTIENIPFGTACKVSETGWSWRYAVTWDDDTFANSGFTPTSYHDSESVTATNAKDNDKWMDSSSCVSNKFSSGGIVESDPTAAVGSGED